MPQLDKYIFYSNITYFSFFFILIYMYLRSTVIPNVSSMLKYRKKKFENFAINLETCAGSLELFNHFFEKKSKNVISIFIENSIHIIKNYTKQSFSEIFRLYLYFFQNIITVNNNSFFSFVKVKSELFRFTSLTKSN